MLRRIRIASATGSSIDCKIIDADTGEEIGKRGPYIQAIVADLFPGLQIRLAAGEPSTARVDIYEALGDMTLNQGALVMAFDFIIQVDVPDDIGALRDAA